MSEQFYDVVVTFKKKTVVRVYAANKKAAKERVRELSPEKSDCIRKYMKVLGEKGYLEGSWQPTNEIIAREQDEKGWSDYSECISTVDGEVVHCKKHT